MPFERTLFKTVRFIWMALLVIVIIAALIIVGWNTIILHNQKHLHNPSMAPYVIGIVVATGFGVVSAILWQKAHNKPFR